MRAVRFRVAASRYGAWACGRLRQFSGRHLCRPYVTRYGGGECGGGSFLFPPSDVKRLWPGVSGGVAGLCIRPGLSFFSHASADFFRTFEA